MDDDISAALHQLELEQRHWEESRRLLKEDSENYWDWLSKLDEGYEDS